MNEKDASLPAKRNFYFFCFFPAQRRWLQRKKQNGGKKVGREVLPAAGIPLWVRPQEAQALQHAGQRPWSPLSGPMRAGWRPGKLPTARAPGAWALWPMTGRRRSRGHAAIYSAVELEPVRPPRQSCGQRGSRQRLAALLAGAG